MAEEESRKGRRWLLPFTSGVDLPAIASALRLADMGGATLVAVSFIATPDGRGVRLEHIQQSKDFLEAIRHKAFRLSIPVECHEVFTGDILASIATQIRNLACDRLVLASEGERAFFLQKQEMQQLVLSPPATLVLLRFSPQASSGRSGLAIKLLSWVQQLDSSFQIGHQKRRTGRVLDLDKGRRQRVMSSSEPSALLSAREGTAREPVSVDIQRETEA
jgi:hypothetical protein